MGSPRATNEANYLFQKFFRAGLGTNQMDNPARFNYLRALKAHRRRFRSHQFTAGTPAEPPAAYQSPFSLAEEAQQRRPWVLGKLDDLPKADMVLVLGADVTPELPPLGWKLHEAKEKDGFKLVVANNRKTKFDRYATCPCATSPAPNVSWSPALIKAFLAANPDWTPAVTATGLDELKEAVKKFTAKEVAAKTGVETRPRSRGRGPAGPG